ncbi:hypothetical protein CgunFtcFv8_007605 [Champsocephalus gunnari]|uniref:Uncharacterized protein n=1 Tax=Champsocephalus gunnari TaxID=52237 RepID=A0AAN8CHS4_CHAGU|nr:hypothetical protein CgunFtcFv8_007605 [Champsocephalus gunnari]
MDMSAEESLTLAGAGFVWVGAEAVSRWVSALLRSHTSLCSGGPTLRLSNTGSTQRLSSPSFKGVDSFYVRVNLNMEPNGDPPSLGVSWDDIVHVRDARHNPVLRKILQKL